MPDAPYSQPNLNKMTDDRQFDHILNQLEQQRFFQQHVVTVLTEAMAAFTAQCTDPDGYRFMRTCEDLIRFLNFGIPIGSQEQKLLMQVLQVACAMHENAVNDPALTPTQRSSHQLATTSLLPLCRTALQYHITNPDIWPKVCQIVDRAQQAHAKATDALDLSKYLDFNNPEDDLLFVSEKDRGLLKSSPNTMPSPLPPVSEPAKPKGTVRATVTGARRTTRSAKRKEQALATERDKPYKPLPLGRSHTAPNLSQTTGNPYPSRTSVDQMPSKARGHALDALEETEE